MVVSKRARDQLHALADTGLSVVLAYPTVLESYTLISNRLGYTAASGWLEDVSALLNPTSQDYRDATVLVRRIPDQNISLFDATLAIFASRLGVSIWTCEHHFVAMNANV